MNSLHKKTQKFRKYQQTQKSLAYSNCTQIHQIMKRTSRHYLPNREFSFQEITYTSLQFSISYLNLGEKKACGMEGFIITAYMSTHNSNGVEFAFFFLNYFALEIQSNTREMCIWQKSMSLQHSSPNGSKLAISLSE